jgi:hypothetical protein
MNNYFNNLDKLFNIESEIKYKYNYNDEKIIQNESVAPANKKKLNSHLDKELQIISVNSRDSNKTLFEKEKYKPNNEELKKALEYIKKIEERKKIIENQLPDLIKEQEKLKKILLYEHVDSLILELNSKSQCNNDPKKPNLKKPNPNKNFDEIKEQKKFLDNIKKSVNRVTDTL